MPLPVLTNFKKHFTFSHQSHFPGSHFYSYHSFCQPSTPCIPVRVGAAILEVPGSGSHQYAQLKNGKKFPIIFTKSLLKDLGFFWKINLKARKIEY